MSTNTNNISPSQPQPKSTSRTSPLPPTTQVDPTPTNINKIITIIASAFIHTPLFYTFVTAIDKIPPSTLRQTIPQSRREAYYADGITRVAQSGAIIVEAGNYSALAIWEPPSFTGGDFSSARKEWSSLSRDFTRQVKVNRVKYLGLPGQNPVLDQINEMSEIKLRPFWHLGFLVRNPDVERVPGAVSAVVVPFLERAREENVPVWLEATTEDGVRIYEHYGFRLVATMTVGVGIYGRDGWYQEGGEGCSAFCLIYDQHLREDGGKGV